MQRVKRSERRRRQKERDDKWRAAFDAALVLAADYKDKNDESIEAALAIARKHKEPS